MTRGRLKVFYCCFAFDQVMSYVEAAARKSDLERTELQKIKTGVFSGAYAVNPATGKPIPVWVADYVLGRCSPQSDYS